MFVLYTKMEKSPDYVEHFFGVYLLYCKNPKYKGRTYIGYTVDPQRRIKQHNKGKKFGGAWRTSNRGPWEMVLVVHGFPNSTSALRFEWAWQHPELSRRLKHLPKKKSTQKVFEYCLTVLSEMLKVGPWCRLPLSLRWLADEFGISYSNYVSPPMHMPIIYGKVTTKKPREGKKRGKRKESKESEINVINDAVIEFCSICNFTVKSEDKLMCIAPDCSLISHIDCLANLFRTEESILPIDGNCPKCKNNILWGDLIRKKLGCKMHFEEVESESDVDSDD